MSFRLPVNDPVHCAVKYADLVGGAYGPQVKFKALVQGQEEHIYLPGAATDTLTLLHEAGIIGQLPDAMPGPDDTKGIPLALVARDVVLTLEKSEPKARGRLVARVNGHGQGPASAAPSAPALGAPERAAGHPATSTATAAPLPSLEDRRAATVTSFHAAVNATIRELVPAFAAGGLTVDADVAYRCAFTLFKSWQDRGLA